MEVRHLRHFVAVAEELHFARAAERLGMEQSPLSHSIRNLETELKVRLFCRTTRRTWLTRAGVRFYNDVKRILADLELSACSLTDNVGHEVRSVRLALGEDLATEPFSRLLFGLEHHRPATIIEVRELNHDDGARLVRDGGADILLTLDEKNEGKLHRCKGWDEPLVCIAPLEHAFAARDRIGVCEIARERLALPQPTSCPGHLAQIRKLFSGHGTQATDPVFTTHWNTTVSLVSTGRAIALFPTSLAMAINSVAVIAVEEEDAILTTWLLYPDGEPSPAVSLVLELAEDIRSDVSAGLE